MEKRSSKKYVVAVCLSAVFGILGIHFFYLERYAIGLMDLLLSIAGLHFLFAGQVALGIGLLAVDFLHRLIVTIMLLSGSCRDGRGDLVCYPGQRL